ncbi:hypothetical protein [Tenacibaculum sp. SG-28]|uniref:hypothetical protein n=1 Tax=Tenacibaculum sp. SG-28 TaxID=754426 RepID=UPI000CF50AD5|nr:hypothetical protein [Tenacibaculum sp. SG-28]PQJ21690.1 hypothetical protein BSU00_06290 [Tenacibaculum sp. SG-28]
MHKKLAADLTSLAHSILQMKNKEDVLGLKEKAYEVYEKLTVLAYVDEYLSTTPNTSVTKEELIEKIIDAENKKKLAQNNAIKEESTTSSQSIQKETEMPKDTKEVENSVQKPLELDNEDDMPSNISKEKISKEKQGIEANSSTEEIEEQPFDALEELMFGDSKNLKNDVSDVGERKSPTLDDELKDTLPVDVMANLFEKASPVKSLNDQLQKTIQIGLNDRIAFVKHLFEGNQNDFNRVISQLNTFKTEKEAKKFISKMVKPDYEWSTKEAYEERLIEIIERRFS